MAFMQTNDTFIGSLVIAAKMLWPFNFQWHIQIQVLQTQVIHSLAPHGYMLGARCLAAIKDVGKSGQEHRKTPWRLNISRLHTVPLHLGTVSIHNKHFQIEILIAGAKDGWVPFLLCLPGLQGCVHLLR